jgi:RNA polymerase sigma-54 factor
MALTQRLELRQGQSLVMTPQLQQAIKLLQMSNLELQAYVEGELERNPLLERDEAPEVPNTAANNREAAGSETSSEERIAALDTGLENVYADESRADAANRLAAAPRDAGWSSLRQRSLPLDGELADFDATLTRGKTLSEHLDEQLMLAFSDPGDRLVGQHIIGMMNEAGYLTAETSAIVATLGTTTGHVERVLAAIQGFDPAGVGARNLKECLAIQLKELGRYDPPMAQLIENLELLAKRDFARLKSICGVDADRIAEMVAEIRRLNPKPGHAFGAEPVQPVVPDVYVRPAPDGTWLVELNTETLPRVLVNNQYLARVSGKSARDEDKLYLSECHSNATWLVKSLDQRARTILKVAREIVRQQDGFLVHGVHHLRPLNLKNVADVIGMHESTVSRVTSNKYMATPRGIFELKYFFTTAIASADGGDSHSAEAVRQQIKKLIGEEKPENILSDDAIVEILRATGIEIARRTVAKYRESLGIQSSVQRRRERRAFGSVGVR